MLKRLLLAFGIVVVSAVPAAGADGLEIDSFEATTEGNASVVISLPPSAAVSQPTAEDFAVIVDGIRVSADVYALVGDPMEIVLVMDTSGSMAGPPLDQAKAAAIEFLDRLPATSTNFAVVGFGSEPTVLAEMGASREDLVTALESLEANGETALYDAVVEGAGLFTEAEANKAVVVLTDGGDTASTSSLPGAILAADEAGAEVRPIALQTSESDTDALISLSSSGLVTTAPDAAALAEAYEEVALALTGRYRLTFRSGVGSNIEVTIFVAAPGGVLAASHTINSSTGVVERGVVRVEPPVGFGNDVEVPAAIPTVVQAPGGLASTWALPAGVALLFLGVLAVVGLTVRRDGGTDSSAFEGLSLTEDITEDRGRLAALASRAKTLGDGLAGRVGATALDKALDRAGVSLRPGEFMVLAAAGVMGGITVGLVVGGLFGAVLFGSAAAAAPRTILRIKTTRRRIAFADQLEGTLQTIAGSLRAGYGLLQAISTVASEAAAPTAEEFNRVTVENRLGRTIEESMRGMAERMENEDLGWVVEAIEIQHEVGGNLAEVLDTVTTTIRDRNQIRRQVKALSAEGRISAFVLLALPFVIAGFIAMISPDYLSELTNSTVGRIMLGVAAGLMLAGGAWIRRIIRVQF
jgi:tight adherence protein B